MGVNSNPAPSVAGVHLFMIMPFGTYMTPNRFTGLAAVFAMADSAGTMLSSSGSAIMAPMPLNTVRRGIAFFEIIMISFLSSRHAGRRLAVLGLFAARNTHAEGRARDDA